MKLSAPQGGWMLTIPCLAAATAYIFFIFLPGWKTIEQTRRQMNSKKDAIGQALAVPGALLATQKELDHTKAFVTSSSETTPTPSKLPLLYAQITELVKSSGANTVLFNPEQPQKRDQIAQVPVTMGLSGTAGQIQTFLASLEAIPVRIWVDSLRINKTGQHGSRVNAEVSLVVFTKNSEDSDYVKRADQPIK